MGVNEYPTSIQFRDTHVDLELPGIFQRLCIIKKSVEDLEKYQVEVGSILHGIFHDK